MNLKNSILLLIFSCNLLLAQQELKTISGKITDINNEPLLGVSVYVEGTKKGTETNFNGEYTIKIVRSGDYTIVVSAIGFVNQSKKISPNKSIYNFVLSEENNVIEEVVVTGKTVNAKIESEGFNVQAIEIGQLKAQSLDINQILDNSPGVRVRTTGGVGSDFKYRINGLGGNAIKFFIDEIPMEYYGSSYAINNLPTGLIERVEVYKGVVPVKIGTDALGGAINLVTKKSVDNYVEASTSVGSFYTLQSDVNGLWRFDSGLTTKFTVFSTYSENNYKVWGSGVNYADESTGYKAVEFTKENPAERFNDDFQTVTGKFDIGYTKKKWADEFYVGILASTLKKGVQTAQTMGNVFGKVRHNKKTVMPNMVYKKKNFLKKGLDVNAFAAYSYNEGVLIDTSSVQYDWRGLVIGTPRATGGEMSFFGRSEFTQKQEAQVYRLNTTYKLPLKFKLGLNYLFEGNKYTGEEKYPNINRQAYLDPQTLKKHFGGISLETKKFDNKLNANIFLKYYGYDASINELVYTDEYEVNIIKNKQENWGIGFASSFNITPTVLIKASIEKATRMPTATEALGDGVTIDNNPYIDPERSLNTNLGVLLGRFEIGENHGLKVAINGFYNDTEDRLAFNVTDAQGNGQFINIARVTGTGVDIDITYDYDRKLKFNVNGTYSDLRNNLKYDQYGNENIVYQDRLRNEPYIMANAGLEYNITGFLQKNSKLYTYIGTSYVHEFFLKWPSLASADNKSIIPSQLTFDAGLGYTFPSKKLTLAFDVSNILNEQVYDDFLLQKPGRSFFLKATYQFIKK